MTSVQFAYWLQGFFEIGGESVTSLDAPRVEMIKQHLAMVFVHEIDPSHGGPEEQAKLNAIHNPLKKPSDFPGGLPEYNIWAKENGAPLMRC